VRCVSTTSRKSDKDLKIARDEPKLLVLLAELLTGACEL
jgi:hypothetical protein